MTFKGETKDYAALSTFRDTLVNAQLKFKDESGTEMTEKLFESVTVTQSGIGKAASGSSVVSFDISAIYNPNAFLYKYKEPTVIVKDANTTPSVVGAPRVFGQGTTQGEGQ